MTLILSVVSKHWAMQASDRRFTVQQDGQPSEHIDAQNKAIFVAERLAFAYTGEAQIGGEDTSEWFQRQLSSGLSKGLGLPATLDKTATMLSEYFAALLPVNGGRRHAFVGAGWTDDSFAKRIPMLIWISNFLDDDGGPLVDPRPEFLCVTKPLSASEAFSVHTAGVPLPKETWVQLNALIASQLELSDDPEPIAMILINAIRDYAQVSSSVGPGVMLNNLPRAPGPPGGEILLVGKLPDHEVRTFTYVGEAGLTGQYFGPLVVASDGTSLGGFTAVGEFGLNSRSGMGYRSPTAPPLQKSAIGQSRREFKLGRNDPCWCESGKKYKKCHGP